MASSDSLPAAVPRWASEFPRLGARRLLVLGGLGLFLAGTLFGDVFAVFVLHPNADRIGQTLAAAALAVRHGRPDDVTSAFAAIGGLLENRGTKVDAHAHMIGFGYLALLLAIVFPWMQLAGRTSRRLAILLIAAGIALPVAVFAIHYVGLAFSPVETIGWASIIADAAGLLAAVACAGFLVGLWRRWRTGKGAPTDELLRDRSGAGGVLLAGGLLLILAGLLHGAWFAAADLYRQERMDRGLLANLAESAALDPGGESLPVRAQAALIGYGELQADHAVNIAAHAHLIEFGIVCMMAGFFQPLVFLSETWKRRWAIVLLAGSAILPVGVLGELKFGLIAGGIADAGGVLVIAALAGMLAGLLRHTGKLDASAEAVGVSDAASQSPRGSEPARDSRLLLALAGLALAIASMGYGFYYAVWVEHQTLEGIGGALTNSFAHAARGNMDASRAALDEYARLQFRYTREVDAHSHWIGLAMLLLLLAALWDRLALPSGLRRLLAWLLIAGSALFPLGVLLQRNLPELPAKALAVAGATAVIAGLSLALAGMARRRSAGSA